MLYFQGWLQDTACLFPRLFWGCPSRQDGLVPTRLPGDTTSGHGECLAMLWNSCEEVHLPWGLTLIGIGEGGSVSKTALLLAFVGRLKIMITSCSIESHTSILHLMVDWLRFKMLAVFMKSYLTIPRMLLVPDSHWIKNLEMTISFQSKKTIQIRVVGWPVVCLKCS